MPSIHSLSTLGALAVCLAQAWATPQYGGGNGGSGGWGGDGQGGSGGQGGGDGGGFGGFGGGSGRQQDQGTVTITQTMMMTMTMTETMMMTMGAQPAATVTVTAVAPCNSVVTAYVNTCSAMPGGSNWPPMVGGNGQAQVTTIMFQNFQQGLSSIPVGQAVLTGVTVAAVAPPSSTMSTSMTSMTTMTSAATTAAAAAIQNGGAVASTFTTQGPVSEGLTSIPNPDVANPAATPAVSPAAAQIAPQVAPSPPPSAFTNSGVLGVGAKRWVVQKPTAA